MLLSLSFSTPPINKSNLADENRALSLSLFGFSPFSWLALARFLFSCLIFYGRKLHHDSHARTLFLVRSLHQPTNLRLRDTLALYAEVS